MDLAGHRLAETSTAKLVPLRSGSIKRMVGNSNAFGRFEPSPDPQP
jgi:hypothetical protein